MKVAPHGTTGILFEDISPREAFLLGQLSQLISMNSPEYLERVTVELVDEEER